MRLYQRLKRQILSRVYVVRAALVLAAVAFVVAIWAVIGKSLTSVAAVVWQAATASLPTFAGRTNILILGREGDGSSRAGADLTDTMILVSLRGNGDTVLISIPRDIWVPSLRAKINAAYYYGEQRRPGSGGMVLAKAAVEEAVGQPVHFVAVIDFVGFERIVDTLGGVDVEVENSFVDAKFPVPGREDDDCGGDPSLACRYETISFSAGWQHMDGATALKYVRSRQAEGDEGTDFARSRRQERLLIAIKTKLLSRQFLTNWSLVRSVYRKISQTVVTDIPQSLYLALGRLGLKAAGASVSSLALTEPEWVYHPPVSAAYDFQWVLLPTDTLRANIENLLAVPVQN